MTECLKVCEGGAGVHPRGVQREVQTWLFVRVARGARNPKIVHPQFSTLLDSSPTAQL